MKIDSHIVFLATNDLRETAAFYEEKLGLPLALDQGTCRIYRVARQAFIGFCERVEPVPVAGAIITLVTEQVDEYCNLLRSRGVRVENEPVHNPDYQIYHFFVKDPNGYLVEIQRFDDPRWTEGDAGREAGVRKDD